MKHVRDHIRARQARFAENRLFVELELHEGSPEALSFVSGLTFFVMVFQDILRLNEAKVADPKLRAIARHHREEDRGHDEWFLHDLALLEGRLPDVREVFAPEFATTRDAAYALVAEALNAEDDRVSIALLLVLESTGHVFFDKVIAFLDRIGFEGGLRYFARSHLAAELRHEIWEARIDEELDAIVLTPEQRATVIGAVERCFEPITAMLEALHACTRSAPPSRGNVPPESTTIPRSPTLPSIDPLRRVS